MCSIWQQLYDQVRFWFYFALLLRFNDAGTISDPGQDIPLRLMPLGDSITWGQNSTDGNGYRSTLRQLLLTDGYNIQMVGSRKAGTMPNNENEGYPGYRIDEIQYMAQWFLPWLQPNVITLNAGTNDILQVFDLETIPDRMDNMLEYLWAASPGVTIILSTLTVNNNSQIDAWVVYINNQYKALAQQKLAENKSLVLVDMHGPDGPLPCQLVDGTHPNDIGYMKMGEIWFQGVKKASQKGLIQQPRTPFNGIVSNNPSQTPTFKSAAVSTHRYYTRGAALLGIFLYCSAWYIA